MQKSLKKEQNIVLRLIFGNLSTLILVIACALAFIPRLFSVVRYESVIHEFDPYFNYRSSQYLVKEGIYKFHNWFDERAWYPLGRIVGETVYPGLMWSAAVIYKAMQWIGIPIDVRNSCVLVSPIWAVFTVLVAYYITKTVWNKKAALITAVLVSLVPGYMSRSVGGSFDNECISIFALLAVFALWIKTVQTGSVFTGLLCSIAYFYMASAWGGYVFIINLIPLYVLAMLVMGRYSVRLHVAYTTFYVLGILLSMQIQFVSFMPVQSGEHLAAFGVFAIINLVSFLRFLSKQMKWEHFIKSIKYAGITIGAILLLILIVLSSTHYITPWTGRFYNLLHPTYAKSHIPIISSVSEHQPTAWPHYFFDLHLVGIIFTGGLLLGFNVMRKEKEEEKEEIEEREKKGKEEGKAHIGDKDIDSSHTEEKLETQEQKERRQRLEQFISSNTKIARKNDGLLFVIVYGAASFYFSGVMVRLMLALAPVACIVSSFALERVGTIAVEMLDDLAAQNKGKSKGIWIKIAKFFVTDNEQVESEGQGKEASVGSRIRAQRGEKSGINSILSLRVLLPLGIILFLGICFVVYGYHCLWVASTAYSSPSIVLAWGREEWIPESNNTQKRYVRVMVDDFREAYGWLRHNTDVNAKVMSWWDYGYQLSAVANRTVIVDNNTWNNSHIATVGMAMSSNEDDAYPVLQMLEVDYLLVIFGGISGYSGDDINKFLWMVRIGGGVFPRIEEKDYLSKRGEYRVDSEGGKGLLNCTLYKMCYYDFGKITTPNDQQPGFDLARNMEIGNKDIKFKHLEEVYTSERWIVRIFHVKKDEAF